MAHPVRVEVWRAIREKLAMESHLFSEDDLTVLEMMRLAEFGRIPVPSFAFKGH